MWKDVEGEAGLICPDVSDRDDITFLGNGDTAESARFLIFRVKMCEDEPGESFCKSDEEIREFVSNLVVDSWVSSYAIDFEVYQEQPLVQIFEKDKQNFLGEALTSRLLKVPVIYLRQHAYSTYDDWF